MSPRSVTGAPSEGSVYWRSSQRCMEVNVLLDMLLYWWGGDEGGWEAGEGGCERQFGEKRWRCTGRLTDAKFVEGEEREVTTRRGVRGGEVERKIQRCWEKLTDAAMERREREMGGERAGVSEFFSAFGCGMRLVEPVRQEEEKRSWVDEHGKAFTKSGLPHPQNPVSF